MNSPEPVLDLAELCHQAGVTPRTVRYYIQQGLLPQPGVGREARKYGAPYLYRLRLIRQLQREHLPLAEIRQRLAGLSEEAVAAQTAADCPSANAAPTAREYLDQLLGPRRAVPPGAAHDGASRRPPPNDVAAADETSVTAQRQVAAGVSEIWPRSREQWERLRLHDDVELHIRRPASRDMNRRLDRLLEIARRILIDE
ncbi:MAG: MerR family transcriptional regulator [Gammaproteobacteria bacterium]